LGPDVAESVLLLVWEISAAWVLRGISIWDPRVSPGPSPSLLDPGRASAVLFPARPLEAEDGIM